MILSTQYCIVINYPSAPANVPPSLFLSQSFFPTCLPDSPSAMVIHVGSRQALGRQRISITVLICNTLTTAASMVTRQLHCQSVPPAPAPIENEFIYAIMWMSKGLLSNIPKQYRPFFSKILQQMTHSRFFPAFLYSLAFLKCIMVYESRIKMP